MSRDYFERQYAGAADPWGFTSRWYEQRKRALTLAALPRQRYRSGYEPGCSIGVLTQALAGRCDRLLATDLMPAAVERARARVGHQRPDADRVRIEVGDVRVLPPPGAHDLMVISEVLYYLSEPEAAETAAGLGGRLAADGHLIAVHWRHPVAEHVLTGDRADELLREHSRLAVLGGWCDDDLRLTVLGRDQTSVAQAEGLA